MRITAVFFVLLFSFNTSLAQALLFSPGFKFVYKTKENNENVTLIFQIVTLQPFMQIEWKKNNNFKEEGSFLIQNKAKIEAVNLLFTLSPSSEQIEMMDQLPGFLISKAMFEDLKKNKKTKMRTDCNSKLDEVILRAEKKMPIQYNGKAEEVNILQCNRGIFGDELWVLDDVNFPLIIRSKGINHWELLEITK